MPARPRASATTGMHLRGYWSRNKSPFATRPIPRINWSAATDFHRRRHEPLHPRGFSFARPPFACLSTLMPHPRLAGLTALAMVAFAGNSLLCRAALGQTAIDGASFTTLRIVSGAATLLVLLRVRRPRRDPATPPAPVPRTHVGGSWPSALALLVYAAGFSFAYVSLPAATGALLLFGAVQATMIGYGLATGERLGPGQVIGLVLSFGGLTALLLPGVAAPPPVGSALMIAAGVAWGVYSLRGRTAGDPLAHTAGNFLRASPLALLLSLLLFRHASIDPAGVAYALASGAVASGLGYALWYAVLPSLKPTPAAAVQLSVPVLTAVGGVILLSETLTLRLTLASVAILGGIALILVNKRAPSA